MKHYICRGCGNLVAMVNDTGRRIGCCGSNMNEIVPGAVDASREKHTPVVKEEKGRVTVTVGSGENMHPMTKDHSIGWVCLITNAGTQRKLLPPDGKPEVIFHVGEGEKVIKAFAYCNLHGLWVTECGSCCEK